MEEARTKLLIDGVSNLLLPLTAGFMALLTVPFLLRVAGHEIYGLWLIAMSMASVLTAFDLGLGWSIAFRVTNACGATDSDRRAFLRAAAGLLTVIGLVGAGVIVLLGTIYRETTTLSAEGLTLAPWIFAVAGALFLLGLYDSYLIAVLVGVQRFLTFNTVGSALAVIRGVGTIALSFLPAGLAVPAIGLWWVLVGLAGVATLNALIRAADPGLALSPALPRWNALKGSMEFGIRSQLIQAGTNLTWQAGALVGGWLGGASRIVPYVLAQSIPSLALSISMRMSQPLWPAAGALNARDARVELDAMYRSTVFLVLLFAVPLCAGSLVLADEFLRLWVGLVAPDVVAVMRLLALAVLVQACVVSAECVLWGRGDLNSLSVLSGVITVATLALTIFGFQRSGLVGAAMALLAGQIGGALLVFARFKANQGGSPWGVLGAAAIGIAPALLAMIIVLVALERVLAPLTWQSFLVVGAAAGLVFLGVFLLHGARPEHRELVRRVLRLSAPDANRHGRGA